jgi:hypothetical protein
LSTERGSYQIAPSRVISMFYAGEEKGCIDYPVPRNAQSS